jgi:thiol-disulfide isomerase/thioredoxin
MRSGILLCLLAALCAGCGLLPSSGEDDAVVTWAPQDREPAPAIDAETIEGERLALDELDGPVVVNFWASWCGPCRRETPHLNAVVQAYADEGVSVVGINAKDDLANAQAFASSSGLTYPSWFDPDQALAADFGAGGAVGLPTTLILDRDHRVAVRFFGEITGAALGPRLDEILAES